MAELRREELPKLRAPVQGVEAPEGAWRRCQTVAELTRRRGKRGAPEFDGPSGAGRCEARRGRQSCKNALPSAPAETLNGDVPNTSGGRHPAQGCDPPPSGYSVASSQRPPRGARFCRRLCTQCQSRAAGLSCKYRQSGASESRCDYQKKTRGCARPLAC